MQPVMASATASHSAKHRMGWMAREVAESKAGHSTAWLGGELWVMGCPCVCVLTGSQHVPFFVLNAAKGVSCMPCAAGNVPSGAYECHGGIGHMDVHV